MSLFSLEFFRQQVAPLLVGLLLLAASMMLYRKKRRASALLMFGSSVFLALRILVGYVLVHSPRDPELLRRLGQFLSRHADLAYLIFCIALFLYAAGERAALVSEDPAPSSSTEDRDGTDPDDLPPA